MAVHILKNQNLTLSIDELGAELTAITDENTNTEYLWNGDSKYWKRHSPVLFPIVGSLKNQCYTFDGIEYSMSQHGFARDSMFQVTAIKEDEIWFRLASNEETKKVYPFDFSLEIGYKLAGRQISVLWKVSNSGTSNMYFSIGAHPAFTCPLNANEKQTDYMIGFDKDKPVHYLLINKDGLVEKKPYNEQYTLTLKDGFLPITTDLFDKDALIIENNQYQSISLVTPDKKPYITVTFDAPLFGLWSPAGKGAPFICIEPWYGCCDSSDFSGELNEREWGNLLEAGKDFKASYTIDIA
jgi:galactose mutarotase-like enzyme